MMNNQNILKFETVQGLINEVKKRKISVNFLEMNDFAFSNGKNISINKNLSREAKIFMLAHELGHVIEANSSNQIEHFSLNFEKEDKFALKALFGVHINDKESFRFNNLFKYSYFKKIELPYRELKINYDKENKK